MFEGVGGRGMDNQLRLNACMLAPAPADDSREKMKMKGKMGK